MNSITLLGHRGYNAKYIENTLQSFQAAIDYGADGVELDIQKTRDGKFIIFHDYNLSRLTGKNASVNTIDYVELMKLNLPDNLNIPLLEDFLKIIPEKFYVNIELKQSIEYSDLDEICLIVKKYIDSKYIQISSFHHELLPFFTEKNIYTGMLIGHEQKSEGLVKTLFSLMKIKPAFLNPPIDGFYHINRFMYYSFLLLAKFLGFRLAFYTVNTKEQFNFIKNIADIIITDNIEEVELLIEKNDNRKGLHIQHRWDNLQKTEIQEGLIKEGSVK